MTYTNLKTKIDLWGFGVSRTIFIYLQIRQVEALNQTKRTQSSEKMPSIAIWDNNL